MATSGRFVQNNMMINRGVGLYMLTLSFMQKTRVSVQMAVAQRDLFCVLWTRSYQENDVVAYFARDVSSAHTPDGFMHEIL